MKELILKLNDLKITQTSSDWEEDVPEDIYNEYLDGAYTELAYDLDVDTHRWYETSITVLDFSGFFIGVRYITNMFSESQDYEDCYHHLEFFEMEEFTKISYKKVK
jgi:hypothetical protein